MRVGMFLPLLAVALLMGCGQTQEKKAEVRTEEIGAFEFPDSPSRQAYEGFQWQRSFGAGLRFWAQDNGKIRVMTDASLPGACVAHLENGQWRLSDPVIRVFRLN